MRFFRLEITSRDFKVRVILSTFSSYDLTIHLGVQKMDVDLIFKLAALGILVSVLNMLLSRSGRDDYGLIVTLAGLLVSLLVIIRKVNELFETIRILFEF